jgi:hypothetical protein
MRNNHARSDTMRTSDRLQEINDKLRWTCNHNSARAENPRGDMIRNASSQLGCSVGGIRAIVGRMISVSHNMRPIGFVDSELASKEKRMQPY